MKRIPILALVLTLTCAAQTKKTDPPKPPVTAPIQNPVLDDAETQHFRAIRDEFNMLNMEVGQLVKEREQVINTFEVEHPGWTISMDQNGNAQPMKKPEPPKPQETKSK